MRYGLLIISVCAQYVFLRPFVSFAPSMLSRHYVAPSIKQPTTSITTSTVNPQRELYNLLNLFIEDIGFQQVDQKLCATLILAFNLPQTLKTGPQICTWKCKKNCKGKGMLFVNGYAFFFLRNASFVIVRAQLSAPAILL